LGFDEPALAAVSAGFWQLTSSGRLLWAITLSEIWSARKLLYFLKNHAVRPMA
jgi:hypothetical protein